MAFVPHQTIPGVSPEAAQALLEIQRQIGQDLDELRRGPVVTMLQRADYGARENEYVRCAPQAGGMTILLPPSRPQNQGKSIRVLVETVLSGGGVTISAAHGTINGLVTITLTTVGLVEFTSDGLGNWLSAWAPGTTGTPPGGGTPLVTQSPVSVRGAVSGRRGFVVPGVLPIIPRGNVIGVPIDADNLNEQARALTPFELGRIARFSRQFSETGSGTVTAYSLPDPYTGVTFDPSGDIVIKGMIGGNYDDGRIFFFIVDKDATHTVTLTHDSASVGTVTRRFANPTLADIVMRAGDAAIVFRDPVQDRWVPMLINLPGRLLAFTDYSTAGASGTHTYQTNTRNRRFEMVGAGGQGGGVKVIGAVAGASGGGQGGGYLEGFGPPPGATEAYAVGDVTTNGAGLAGGDGGGTTLGVGSAEGGLGAPLCTATAAAGVSDGGGDPTSPRGDAGSSGWWDAIGGRCVPGIGGSSPKGHGGWRESANGAGSANGAIGNGFGSGGSGARSNLTAGDQTGGAARGGRLQIWEYS